MDAQKKYKIGIDKIKVTRWSLRQQSNTHLDELAESIAEQGLIHPIILTPVDTGDKPIPLEQGKVMFFGVVVGERRFLAMRDILKYDGLVLNEHFRIRTYESKEHMFFDMLSENIHRESIPIPQIRNLVQPLIDKLGIDAVCKKLSKSRQWLKQINVILTQVNRDIQDKTITVPNRGARPEDKLASTVVEDLGRKLPVNESQRSDVRNEHRRLQNEIADKILEAKLPANDAKRLIALVKESPDINLNEAVQRIRTEKDVSKALNAELADKVQLSGEYTVLSSAVGSITLFNNVLKKMATIQLYTDRFFCTLCQRINCSCVTTVREYIRKGDKSKINIEALIIPPPKPIEAPKPIPPPIQAAPEPTPEPTSEPEAPAPKLEEVAPPTPASMEDPAPETEQSLDLPPSTTPLETEEETPIQDNPLAIAPPASVPGTPAPKESPLPSTIPKLAPPPIPQLKDTKPRQTTLSEFHVKFKVEKPYAEKIDQIKKFHKFKTHDDTVAFVVKDYFDRVEAGNW